MPQNIVQQAILREQETAILILLILQFVTYRHNRSQSNIQYKWKQTSVQVQRDTQ